MRPAGIRIVFIGLNPDGTVILVAHRSEMGTGIRTSLPMVLADEMEADWSRTRVEQALGDREIRFSGHRWFGLDSRFLRRDARSRSFGAPDAGGCRGTKVGNAGIRMPARECTRLCMIQLAGRSLSATWSRLAAQQPVPTKEMLRLKQPSEFRYIGKGVPIVDLDGIVTGKAALRNGCRAPWHGVCVD